MPVAEWSSERHVEPYQLVFASRRWYLVARDRDRDAWRTFRVDRMGDPVLTGLRFRHVDAPDAAALVAEGLAVSVYRWQARVLLKLKPVEAAQLISPTTGVLEPARGGTLLRIGGEDLEWIAQYLAGLPCRFRVLEPDELRAALRSLADRPAAGEIPAKRRLRRSSVLWGRPAPYGVAIRRTRRWRRRLAVAVGRAPRL